MGPFSQLGALGEDSLSQESDLLRARLPGTPETRPPGEQGQGCALRTDSSEEEEEEEEPQRGPSSHRARYEARAGESQSFCLEGRGLCPDWALVLSTLVIPGRVYALG